MKSYNGQKVSGRDYTVMLKDQLQELITGNTMSIDEIAEALGRHHETARKVIKELHQAGYIHIAMWRRASRGPITALYLWGNGQDAERMKPLTSVEKLRRYRRSKKGQATRKTYYTCRKLENCGLASIDPLLAAIMGQSARPNKEL